jgi:hypothetical protein
MRKLAYTYGKQLIPRMTGFESLYYALDLNDPKCKPDTMPDFSDKIDRPITELKDDGIFVSPSGSDNADGKHDTPLKSIQKAIDIAAGATGTSKTVYLREGTHYLTETLMLTSKHSDLSIVAYPGEAPAVSGGVELKTTWKASNTTGANIYVTDVSGQVSDVPGLLLDGARATKARFPNLPGGIEASCGYGCMVGQKDAGWTKPDANRFGPVNFYTDAFPEHDRNDTADNWFKHYMIGVDGLCSVYDPPVSYWCSQHPSGGGAFAFRTPTAVQPKADALPHMPYKSPEDARFFVWRPARWANWMFDVKKYDAATNNFTFGHGGFQGARGSDGGGDWFIENVMEELDNPGEFFFEKSTSMLYLYYNGTGAPPADTKVVVPQKQVLLNATGSRWDPIKNVKLSGITYTASAHTYMMPHGVPSAGDWALDRYAAVFLEGTEGAMVDGCTFERLDGNAVMVSGYNRNATIQMSDFSFIGGNAVAAWGHTNETETTGSPSYLPLTNYPKGGVDGTDGNHPRYTTVISNTAREIGLYEKQSSFYIQAKTAQSIIKGNVFFNGPRAGINSNDGD